MGANSISDSAIVSKDDGIMEAYKAAVDQAIYDRGHDTYNGTISTTDGVRDKTGRLNELVKTYGCEKGYSKWYEAAWENTEKWEEVWGAQLTEDTMAPDERKEHEKNNTKRYIFAGWGAY